MAPSAARTVVEAEIARIRVKPGRRAIDEAHVANLMVSFGEIGHRSPISLKPVAGDPNFDWELNAGGHRLEAKRRLGATVIEAFVEDDDELVARVAEVDENLIRRENTPLERAQAIANRLEAWAARYPDRAQVGADGETKARRGRPTKLPHGAAISEAPATMGFAADAARHTGLSRDTIERDLAIYRSIPAGLQEKLLGTWIASNAGMLRQLAALGDRKEQAKVVGVLLSGRTKNLSDARAIAAGNEPSKPAPTTVDESVKAFRAVWAKATPSAKAAILHELSGKKLPAGYSVTGPADA